MTFTPSAGGNNGDAVSLPYVERLHAFADREVIVTDDERVTYAELTDLIDEWRDALRLAGVGRGDVVSLDGDFSPMCCAGLLALAATGAIVLPVATASADGRRRQLEIAQVERAIRVDEGGSRVIESTGVRADHELYERLRDAGHPGLVLFSSGSSGEPKASVLDLAKVLDRYDGRAKPYRIVSFLNLDHIGGLNTVLHTLGCGGTVGTLRQRSPDAVFAAIERQRLQVLPTTPTFLRMVLLSGAYERHSTRSLELVTYGTEPMPVRTLKRLNEVLPHVRFKQTYGLSELGILPTRSKSADTVWLQLGTAGFAHKVVDGVLFIRSETAMLGYLNAPAPFDDEGYFNTQDEVEVDGDYLRILGRRSDVINVAGEKVYPAEVEDVLLQVPNIAEATVGGRPNAMTGMVVTATVRLVEPEDEASVRRRVREACAGRLERYKIPATVHVSTAPAHTERFKKSRTTT